MPAPAPTAQPRPTLQEIFGPTLSGEVPPAQDRPTLQQIFSAPPAVPTDPAQILAQQNGQSSSGYKPTFPADPGDSVLKATAKSIGNLPSSFMNFVGGLAHAVFHPIDTVKGLGSVIAGGAEELGQKLGTGNDGKTNSPLPFQNLPTDESTQAFDSFKQAITDKYGSLSKAQKTAETDPFGFGSDVLSILDAGAGLAGKADLLHSYVSSVGGPAADLVSKAGDASGISKVIESAKNSVKNFSPSSSFLPENKALFDSEGIKAPVSALTTSPMIKGLEAVASKTAFGGDVADIATDAKSQLEGKVSDLISKMSQGNVSSESLGRTIKDGLEDVKKSSNDFVQNIVDQVYPKDGISDESLGKLGQGDFKNSEQSFEDAQNKIYTEFKNKYGDTTTVPGNTRSMLSEILTKQGKDWYAGIDPKLQKLFKKLSGETDEVKQLRKEGYPEQVIDQTRQNTTVPFDQLQIIKESIGQAMIKFDDPDLKRIYGAISQDLNQAVESSDPGAGDRLNQMNAKFHSGKQALESNLSSSVTQSSPENIPKNLISKNSADAIQSFKSRVSPDTFKKYSDFFVRNIFDSSMKNGELDISKLKENIGNYDPETIKAWLGKDYEKFQNTISSLDSVDTVRNSSEVKLRKGILDSLSKKNPKDIADALFGQNSATTFKTVKDAIGPEKFSEVQKYFTKDLFEKSVSKLKSGDTDIAGTVKKIRTNLGKYDDDTLNQIFGPGQKKDLDAALSQLDKYKSIDDALKVGQKNTQGSQTAFLRDNISKKDRILTALGAAATGHPAIAAGVALDFAGEAFLSKMFTTDIGRKILTEGLTAPNLTKLKNLNLSDSQILQISTALKDENSDKDSSSARPTLKEIFNEP